MGYWVKFLLLWALPAISVAEESMGTGPWELDAEAVSFSTLDSMTSEEAVAVFSAKKGDFITGRTTFGMSDHFHWLLVPVCNPAAGPFRGMLLVDNPHIDRIMAWARDDDSLRYLGISGDRMPFHDRTVMYRAPVFAFDLPEGGCTDLLLMVDKRNASVTVPLEVWERDAFLNALQTELLMYGMFFGTLLIIILYSLLIGAMQRKGVYGWYGIYVILLSTYLFVAVGYGFQYLYPWSSTLNNYARLVLIVLILFSFLRFTRHFLLTRQRAKGIDMAYGVMGWMLLGIIAWWMLSPGLFTAYTVVVINVVYGFMAVAVLLLVPALRPVWREERSAALFYMAAFSVNIIAFLLVVAEEYGLLSLHWLPIGPIFIGSLAEILIFSFALSYRSRLVTDDREKLLTGMANLRRDASEGYIRGMEEEKARVAAELHDDIASRLAVLRLSLPDGKETVAVEDIAMRVRSLSHRLSPAVRDDEAFTEQVQHLVREYRQAGLDMRYRAFDLPASIPKETGMQLLRILQEAVQNIIKHAKAGRVDIQLFHHDNELVMTIEDDGIGFDPQTASGGAGLRNMRLRAENTGGELEVSSAPGRGTSVMVMVPLAQ
jgi:signal transduction histidine kinase